MKNLSMVILIFSTTACQTGVVPISRREYLHEKEGKSASLSHRRPIEEESRATPEVFVKRESLALVPKAAKNYTGSLFSLNKAQHLLFVEPPRAQVGDLISVAVRVNRGDKSKSPAAPEASAPAVPPVSAKPGLDKALQEELIAALPKLEPGLPDPKIPSILKMMVVRELENGDVIVEANRASENDWESQSIRAQGRIPRAIIQGKQEITTLDLSEVQWYESQNGELIERESSQWEDEYTLRFAGFDEARSKMALDLENKRKDMEKVKDRLQERIVSVGKERGKVAEERERVAKLRQEAEVKLGELNRQVSEQDSLIGQQKETIIKQEQLLESLQQGGGTPSPASTKTNLSTPEAKTNAKAD